MSAAEPRRLGESSSEPSHRGGDTSRADLRASDADRDSVATRLREQCTAGRISLDELSDRLARAYAARTFGELDAVMRDLPVLVAPRRPSERPAAPRTRDQGLRTHMGCFLIVNAMLVAIWALTGAGYFWPVWPLLGWGTALALAAVAHARGAQGPTATDRHFR